MEERPQNAFDITDAGVFHIKSSRSVGQTFQRFIVGCCELMQHSIVYCGNRLKVDPIFKQAKKNFRTPHIWKSGGTIFYAWGYEQGNKLSLLNTLKFAVWLSH